MTKVYITESGYKLNVASTLRMTASEAETLLDGVFEPVLGNPGTNGYVLSSTTGGTRSWVAQDAGASDVDDLTTTSGSGTDMLRVAAAGGLEYRTAAQVLGDIGAAPTASPTFTGTVTLPTTVASVIKPASDSTTALQLANAAGTAVLTVDTTNGRVGVGVTPTFTFDVLGTSTVISQIKASSSGSFSAAIVAANTAQFQLYAFGSTRGGTSYGGVTTNSQVAIIGALASSMYVANSSQSAPVIFGSQLIVDASTTAAASLRIRSGTAPTTPNAGDIWFDGTNLKMYDGITTRTIFWT
jgi:hypothetical protein